MLTVWKSVDGWLLVEVSPPAGTDTVETALTKFSLSPLLIFFCFVFQSLKITRKRPKTKITTRAKHHEINQPHSPSLQKSTYPPPTEITAESNLLALNDLMVFLPPFFFLAKKADADSAILL